MARGRNIRYRRAFTLLELLVTIAIFALLVSLLLPGITAAKSRGLRTQCLNNNRQLIFAWTLYAGEHEDEIPPNVDGVDGNGVWTNWVAGTMSHSEDATNVALLVDRTQSLIAYYIENPILFKCPGDKSRNVRSFAMNHRLNPVRYGGPPVFTQGLGTNWMTYTRVGQIQRPSEIFVTIDERSDSINDAYFVVDVTNTGSPDGMGVPTPYTIVDYPANNHGGSTISFADGHSEVRAWREATTKPPPGQVRPRSHTSATDRDLEWLQEHATERIH
jgi:prepilin-type N-terminal cleavage/methylation domain-containing protein/prepilin-type processing-associated H-X9-DG protein